MSTPTLVATAAPAAPIALPGASGSAADSAGIRGSASASTLELLKACNEGRYADAESLIERTLLQSMKQHANERRGIKDACESATRSQTIESIDQVETKIQHELAGVRLVRHFKDGSSEQYTVLAVPEEGVWRITAMDVPQR